MLCLRRPPGGMLRPRSGVADHREPRSEGTPVRTMGECLSSARERQVEVPRSGCRRVCTPCTEPRRCPGRGWAAAIGRCCSQARTLTSRAGLTLGSPLGLLSWGARDSTLGLFLFLNHHHHFPLTSSHFLSYVQTVVVLAQNLVQKWPDHSSTEDTSHWGYKSSVAIARAGNNLFMTR